MQHTSPAPPSIPAEGRSIHHIPLSSLAPDVRFPPGLAERISYDPQTQLLSFRGYMSKCDYDKLVSLSQDLRYQVAVSQLFPLCTETNWRRSSMSATLIGGAAAAALLIGLGIMAVRLLSR